MVRMEFLGLIPIGNHWTMISLSKYKKSESHREYTIRDNGYGSLAKVGSLDDHNQNKGWKNSVHRPGRY